MNFYIYSADRATHLKIVIVALLAAAAVTSVSASFRSYSKSAPLGSTAVLKAGKTVAVSSSGIVLTR